MIIFVPDYAIIVKPINLFLKKDQIFEWIKDIQQDLNNIKHDLKTIWVQHSFETHF